MQSRVCTQDSGTCPVCRHIPVPQPGKYIMLLCANRISPAQKDKVYLSVELPGDTERDRPLPTVTHPTLLSFTTPTKGFGMFAATDIPWSQTEGINARPSKLCIATYGGVVCTEHEVGARPDTYEMAYAVLPRTNGREEDERYVCFYTAPTSFILQAKTTVFGRFGHQRR